MPFDTTEYTELRHIGRIVWKPINWYRESPDQYPGRVPADKEETMIVPLSLTHGGALAVAAKQFASEIIIFPIAMLGSPTPDPGPVEPCVATVPAALSRHVADALLELHRMATRGATPVMQGIERIEWKSRRPRRQSPNYMALLLPGIDEDGHRMGIFFSYDRRAAVISVHWGLSENLHSYGEMCEHNAWCDPDFADGFFHVPVDDAPAVAYAILYIHRRTREHDYEGRDAGLVVDSGTV